MRSRRSIVAFSTALAAAAVLASGAARADAVEDFYKGRSVDLVISTTTGGGYDTIARVLARYMPAHIAGNPKITPKNMPGAGGIKAANYLASEGPRDGSMFATIQNPVPFQPLLGVQQAMYDARKFSWIGSANTEIGLVFVWHTSKVTKFEDLMTREVTVAGTGGGSSTDFYYRLLNEFVGTKLKSITGYPGSTESFLALERGEVEGFFLFWSTMKSSYAQRLEKKEIRNIAQFSLEKSPELPDVPFANDYIKDPKNRQAFEFAVGPLAMGRPYVAPEGLPADRLKALRTAFLDTLKDPQFVAEAHKLKLDLSGIKSGEEVSDLVNRLYATPKDVVAKVAEITKGM
ncbi:MAG: Bug family tripartite tricarboxylate transporter substrate binding protein [Gemmatimonas sp.]